MLSRYDLGAPRSPAADVPSQPAIAAAADSARHHPPNRTARALADRRHMRRRNSRPPSPCGGSVTVRNRDVGDAWMVIVERLVACASRAGRLDRIVAWTARGCERCGIALKPQAEYEEMSWMSLLDRVQRK